MIKHTFEQFMESKQGGLFKWGLSFLLGLLFGAVLHFVLYRIALPVEPFIYVSF